MMTSVSVWVRKRWPRLSCSGPRYTICSHIWCTRASVISLSRVALTTPAIPHMAFFLSFQAHGNRTGFCCQEWQVGEPLEAIVAVITGIALAAVAGGEQDVGHLARGDKVQRFVS